MMQIAPTPPQINPNQTNSASNPSCPTSKTDTRTRIYKIAIWWETIPLKTFKHNSPCMWDTTEYWTACVQPLYKIGWAAQWPAHRHNGNGKTGTRKRLGKRAGLFMIKRSNG